MAVRPLPAAVADEVFVQGSDGSNSFEVRFGYSSDYTPEAYGMIPATQEQATVVDDSANDMNVGDGRGNHSA